MASPSCAELLGMLHELVTEQRRLCEQGELDRALALMPARNDLFEQLAADFDDGAVAGTEMHVLELLQNIIADDSLLLEMLRKQKRQLQQDRIRVRQGRKLLRGYAAPAS